MAVRRPPERSGDPGVMPVELECFRAAEWTAEPVVFLDDEWMAAFARWRAARAAWRAEHPEAEQAG